MFYYFERKNDKILTFNIVHLANFEISGKRKIRGNTVFIL